MKAGPSRALSLRMGATCLPSTWSPAFTSIAIDLNALDDREGACPTLGREHEVDAVRAPADDNVPQHRLRRAHLIEINPP